MHSKLKNVLVLPNLNRNLKSKIESPPRLFLFLYLDGKLLRSAGTTTAESQRVIAQDDPAQFLTRIEVFNELQHHKTVEYLNVTTVRSVIALGKKFTTRFDVPIVYNSMPVGEYAQTGIGDISIRLLGYKFMESGKSAILASVEFSFNTAQSPLLGSGKNIIIPVFTYSFRIPSRKTIVALIVPAILLLSGDESQNDISWTKLQAFHIKA